MDPNFVEDLNTEELSDFHKFMLEKCKTLVAMSRNHMSSYYDKWDNNQLVFRGERQRDASDKEAASRKEPEKMVVPLTFAQSQTFVAFGISLFTQREHVFELVGTGEEDHKAAKVAEAVIQRDLTHNIFEAKLSQFLYDIARFSFGVLKTAWVEESRQIEAMEEVPSPTLFGQSIFQNPTMRQITTIASTFKGNKIVNVSPYCFFPDVRVPLSRFQEGEFVASEEIYNMNDLYSWQADGKVVGISHIKPFKGDGFNERVKRTHLSRAMDTSVNATIAATQQHSQGVVLLNEIQIALVPKLCKYDGPDGPVYPFGESERPEKWLVWYVNDSRIINLEKLDFNHGDFTYDIAEFSPDIHRLVNQSLCDMIDKLQDVNSWLINTHITNVRKVVGDKLIVDPSGIVMEDLKERRPVIRLTKDAARTGVDKWVKQLNVSDVTARHMQDASEIHGLAQVTTGINDNALGQYNTGRRTATESRNANTGAAARLKLVALLIFKTALEPMARKMISNHQQGLDVETYVRVIGETADPLVYRQFKKVTRQDLIGSYDFEVFDGTLPSERAMQANALEEFLVTLMGNPQVVMMMGFDPIALVEEWLQLRGIRNPKRFRLSQIRQQELAMQMQQAGLYATGTDGAAGPGVSGAQAGLSMLAGGNAQAIAGSAA